MGYYSLTDFNIDYRIYNPYSYMCNTDQCKAMIPAHTTIVSYNVSIIDDKIVEDNETFSLRIELSLTNNVNRTDPYVTTVTIMDNDNGK